MSTRVLLIFGTRPEAIKLAPLVAELRRREPLFDARVLVTAQHRALLDQVLATFGLTPDLDLDLMREGQGLADFASRALAATDRAIDAVHPHLIVVQGDTSTTFVGALAGFYRHVPVAHVEAGLRSFDLARPFPEEMNRVLVARIAELHFAPTPAARANLIAEGIPAERIHVTGNTGIDALLSVAERVRARPPEAWDLPVGGAAGRRLVLLTAHRRENHGAPLAGICAAVRTIVARRPDVEVLFSVHPNPEVRSAAERELAGCERIRLAPPLEYPSLVAAIDRATLVLTDSGGIQEEAPSLGKPVLVLRDVTERAEGVAAGNARLVGTDPARIVEAALALLDDRTLYERMARARNPYGDGQASARIATILASRFAAKAAAA
jgi:UDP-N-acetylglucosamine 2-epimerase (non-hydrolysing)